MIKIAVVNQKGGVGKTTSVVNIAACLEKEHKKRILVVDGDASINASNYLLTYSVEGDDATANIPSVVDVVNGNLSARDALIQVKQEKWRRLIDTNIYLLPGSMRIEQDCQFLSDYTLKNALSPLESEFDFCLFDCPPTMTNFTYEALACCQYVIVPAFPDTDSLWGFSILVDLVNNMRNELINPELQILGIFFTNVQSVSALSKYYQSSYENNDLVFSAKISRSSAVEQSRFYGRPLVYYKPSNASTQDYKKLTEELLKRIRKMGGL